MNNVDNCVGIYGIFNLIIGKIYIGSSNNLPRRKHEHFYRLKNNRLGNHPLQNAYNKYGKESFKFYIIEYCNKNELVEKEQYYLELFKTYRRDCGYNCRHIAEVNSGYKFSEITRKRMSEGHLSKVPNLSDKQKEERRERMLGNKFMLGYKHSEETRKKISDTNKGKRHSEESKKKMAQAQKGKKCSERTKKKLSDKLSLRWKDEEFTPIKEKLSEEMKLRWKDEEFRKKTTKAMQSFNNNPDYKNNMSILVKKRYKDDNYRNNISNKIKIRNSTTEHKNIISNKLRKFNDEVVSKIRNLSKDYYNYELAKMFNCSADTIYKIKKGIGLCYKKEAC